MFEAVKNGSTGCRSACFSIRRFGSKAHKAVLKAFDAWIEGAKSRKGGYVLDTYNMIVIQLGLDSVLQLDEMMDTVGFFRE